METDRDQIDSTPADSQNADPSALRILLVEDNRDDALLINHQLTTGLPQPPQLERVVSREQLTRQLTRSWDVVLCDYSMPSLTAAEVVELIHTKDRHLPIIIVSGAVGEERAASLVRSGAHDFVMKGNLSRLVPAIDLSLREAAAHRFSRRAEKAYANIVEHSLQALFVVQHGRIVFANRAAAELTDRSIAELMAMSPSESIAIVHESDRNLARRTYEALISKSKPHDRYKCRLTSTYEGTRIVEVYASSIDFDGQPAAHLAAIDVTNRTHLEEALLRGKREWESTFDTVREVIVITDRNHRILRLNRALATRLNASVRDLVGLAWDEVSGIPADRWLVTRSDGSAVRDMEAVSEPLGGRFHFSTTGRTDEHGSLIGAIHVGRDVTTQRQAEEVARRRLSIDETDRIFRTFRHELGNALNTLKTTLAVYKKNFAVFDEEKRETYLQRCLNALRLAEQLLYAVRTYQTLDEVHLEPLEINGFVRAESDLLFENPRSRGMTCRVIEGDQEIRTMADRDAVMRVLLNLIDNAASACDGIDAPEIEIECGVQHHDAVVRIRDNGRGIPIDQSKLVFSPFFTTKDDGSGMGLAIVQKLMVRMNGIAQIGQSSHPGTTIELHLPLLDGD